MENLRYSEESDRALENIIKLLAIIGVDIDATGQLLIIFFLVFNQLESRTLFYNKFYFTPLRVSRTCAHHQEVKIALYSLWYHHTYRWPSRARDDHL